MMSLLKCGLEAPDFPDPPSWVRDAVVDEDGNVRELDLALSDTLETVASRITGDAPCAYACKVGVADVSVWFTLRETKAPDLSRYEQGIDVDAAERDALNTSVGGFLGSLGTFDKSWVALPSLGIELEISMSFPFLLLTPHVLTGDLLREFL